LATTEKDAELFGLQMKRANKIKKLSKTDPPVKLKAKTCKEQCRKESVDHIRGGRNWSFLPINTACLFDIRLYLTPLGQARQFK
jgi:hypothetical protein